jgi:23S rRNA (adenine2503-C2)-methyltransferase
LARILEKIHCRVNLIMLSTVAEFKGRAPSLETARMFISTLEKAHINATLRVSKGGNINAACGQLRLASLKYLL